MTGKRRNIATNLLLQVFGDDNVSVGKDAVFPGCSSLLAQTHDNLADVQKFITLKAFIVSGNVNKC
jgi:hypothetical protein